MSRAFTSSDPAAVAEFCRLRDSLSPEAAASSLRIAWAQIEDLRKELASERSQRIRWETRVQLLESRIDTIRKAIR